MIIALLSTSAKLAPAQPGDLPDSTALKSVLEGNQVLNVEGRILDKKLLATLYAPRQYQPIWTDARRESFRRALDAAVSQGLDRADYPVDNAAPVARELLETDSFIRYARDLTQGRVPPAAFEDGWYLDTPKFDLNRVLEAALAGDVASVLDDLPPHLAAYKQLQIALQRYRGFAETGWPSLDGVAALRLGLRGANVQYLRDRLSREGYLFSNVSDNTLYDRELAAAVARFQATHGLAIDGVTGAETRAALNVPASDRVHQIILNLERWRSLPRIEENTRIEVNAASATAAFYQGDQPIKTTRVIVGSLTHHTPVLRAEMEAVLFNPPWNVPNSIYRKELRPAIRRDPSYMERGNYVYREVNGATQLVQLPGPKNALGRIKFDLPNPADVYLHDTPDRKLFARAKRFFSHGCVRVEDPRDLARLVLHSPDWSNEAIDAAIASGKTERVPLPRPVPVYILYWTAFVDPDGTVEFRDDAYNRDRRLDDALAAHSTTPQIAGAVIRACAG